MRTLLLEGDWMQTLLLEGDWIRTLLLEGLDPDVVAGRGVNWKGIGSDVDGRDAVAGRVGRNVDWKGWKGRQLEGLEGRSIGRDAVVFVDCFD